MLNPTNAFLLSLSLDSNVVWMFVIPDFSRYFLGWEVPVRYPHADQQL